MTRSGKRENFRNHGRSGTVPMREEVAVVVIVTVGETEAEIEIEIGVTVAGHAVEVEVMIALVRGGAHGRGGDNRRILIGVNRGAG